MSLQLDDTIRKLIDGPHATVLATSNADGRYAELRGRVEITEDPEKTLAHEMYALRYMGHATLPPEPGAERLIVRITADKLYHWPPLATGHLLSP